MLVVVRGRTRPPLTTHQRIPACTGPCRVRPRRHARRAAGGLGPRRWQRRSGFRRALASRRPERSPAGAAVSGWRGPGQIRS